MEKPTKSDYNSLLVHETVRDRISILRESSQGALTIFYRKLAMFMDCRNRLRKLCSEMELDVSVHFFTTSL